MSAISIGLRKYMYTQECEITLVEKGSSSSHCESTPFMAISGDKDERLSHRLKSIPEDEWNRILAEQLASGVLVHRPEMPSFDDKEDFILWYKKIGMIKYNEYSMANIVNGNEFTFEEGMEGCNRNLTTYTNLYI